MGGKTRVGMAFFADMSGITAIVEIALSMEKTIAITSMCGPVCAWQGW